MEYQPLHTCLAFGMLCDVMMMCDFMDTFAMYQNSKKNLHHFDNYIKKSYTIKLDRVTTMS